MKRIFIIMLLAIVTCNINAVAEVVVYSMMGKVEIVKNGQTTRLKLRDKLSGKDVLNIPYRGCVVLFDAKNKNQYTIKTAGTATVNQLVNDKKNTIKSLTSDYIAFITGQINGGGQTMVRNCSDPATVTRELGVYSPDADSNSGEDGLVVCGSGDYSSLVQQNNDDFDDFVKDINADFESFRTKIMKEYTDFVRHPWSKMDGNAPVEAPKDDMVKPEPAPTNKFSWNIFKRKNKQPVKGVVTPLPPVAEPQPEPVEPIAENTEVTTPFGFSTFGTDLQVRLGDAQKFTLANVSEGTIADALMKLSGKAYDNAIHDCLEIRKNNGLGDWAYYEMLVNLGDAFLGKGTNEATLFTAYLMQQSGYKIRLGRENNKLHIMICTNHFIYGYSYFDLPEGHFFVMDGKISSMNLCNHPFPAEKNVSLYIPEAQKFTVAPDESQTRTAKNYKNVTITYTTNKNLLSFYDTYPASEINDNKMTRWAMLADTPLDPYVKDQIYPQLTKELDGKTNMEKVSMILDLVQTAFKYDFDDTVWGHDRAFFAEETLHYPACDCEDHAILFTRLVRDLVGLKCVLIYYPGHLASAVCFNDDKIYGDYYDLNDTRYTVCDATYYDAPVGMSMPTMMDKPAELIELK